MRVGKYLLIAMLTAVNCAGQARQPAGPCERLPLLAAAVKALPKDLRFPCDAAHVVLIDDYEAFLRENPEIAAHPALSEKGRHALAFVVMKDGPSWPVYFNRDGHGPLEEAFRTRGALAFVVAAVLAHERVHALGEASEAAGLRAELALERRFRTEGKLPALFDLAGMEKQVADQERAEAVRRVSPR